MYASNLSELPPAEPGSLALLKRPKDNRIVGKGIYTPESPLAFRCMVATDGVSLDGVNPVTHGSLLQLSLRHFWFHKRMRLAPTDYGSLMCR